MAHIALLTPMLGGGGTERVLPPIAEGLAARGHTVDMVFPLPVDGGYPAAFPNAVGVWFLDGLHLDEGQRRALGIPASAMEFRETVGRARRLAVTAGIGARQLRHRYFRRGHISAALRILAYADVRKPDILVSNNPGTAFPLYYLAGLLSDFPPVASIFHNILKNRKEMRRHRELIPASAHVIAVSRGLLRNLEAAGVARPGRCTAIHNPVHTPGIAAAAEAEPDHPWFSDGGPPIVLAAGRLAPQKDFAMLIDAFRRIVPICRLMILGEGPLRPQLESRVCELGLEDWICLPGWVKNPWAFMARARLFVLSSRHEGLPTVLIEALACGCPVVSTDCPSGPAEILEDPALLAPVGDPEALAQVMLRALSRPVDKAALRASAARFSVERAVEGYEALIADILAERHRQ